jgi:hypothetical protein
LRSAPVPEIMDGSLYAPSSTWPEHKPSQHIVTQ